MKGTIITTCAVCGKQFRVEVNFPAFNKPFDSLNVNCPKCGIELTVFDPHKYKDDGTILEQ